jgi:hypothetical protein
MMRGMRYLIAIGLVLAACGGSAGMDGKASRATDVTAANDACQVHHCSCTVSGQAAEVVLESCDGPVVDALLFAACSATYPLHECACDPVAAACRD